MANKKLISRRASLLVIGHWMVDRILQLPEGISLDSALPGEHIHIPIHVQKGGSGYHFSMAARDAGFKYVSAIACVGDDEEGRMLVAEGTRSGIHMVVGRSKMGTGEALLIYDADGRRASFGTRKANLQLPMFSHEFLRKLMPENAFMAGHILEDKRDHVRVIKILRMLRDGGCFTVLDVVPHNIQESLLASTRKEIRRLVSGVIGTRKALAPFLSGRVSEGMSVMELVNELLEIFEWVCLHPNNQLLVIGRKSGSKKRTYEVATGYESFHVKAGVLDRSVALELHKHIIERKTT